MEYGVNKLLVFTNLLEGSWDLVSKVISRL